MPNTKPETIAATAVAAIVVVHVRGGLVQAVYADRRRVEVTVIDEDSLSVADHTAEVEPAPALDRMIAAAEIRFRATAAEA